MVTRWKKLKSNIKKVIGLIRSHKKSCSGVAGVLLGIFFFGVLIVYRTMHPTGEAIFYGILANLFLGVGGSIVLKEFLNGYYKQWDTQEKFFDSWKKEKRKQRKIMIAVISSAMFVAGVYLRYLLAGGVYNGNGWYYNYASSYLMIITVLLQSLLITTILHRFMSEKIQQYVENSEKINQLKLENALNEALEIERKSLEKVSRSDQLRVELITNVSHDLKTPLTSMVGYLELIKKEELSDVVRDYVDVISMRAEKLKEMINSLFSLAKASSGNVELHIEELDLNRLLEQIQADLKDKIDSSNLSFVLQLTKEDTKFRSDNMYCYRICQNLIENALKYSAKGTRVFIKTFRKDKWLCMNITNTAGYFMDFEKEDIMERFARGDKERTSEGNGLGLAIVSSYAKALGGEFDIFVDCDQFKACLKLPEEI